MNKKVSYVCTIGPASGTKEIIMMMHKLGMSVARFNMSYSDTHILNYLQMIKELNNEGCYIETMFDLAGPEIRAILPHDISFKRGDIFVLNEDIKMTQGDVTLLKRGDLITFKDAEDKFLVINSIDDKVRVRALNDGIINDHNKIYNEKMYINLPFLSKRDIETINMAIEHNITYLALSFVKNKADIDSVREMVKDTNIKIVSKIENILGVKNIDEIALDSDEIMIARGDLGTTLPLTKIGYYQKILTKAINKHHTPLMLATGILGSLEQNKVPSRAEVLDLYNIIKDGATKVLFSNETAASIDPLNTLNYANEIISSVK